MGTEFSSNSIFHDSPALAALERMDEELNPDSYVMVRRCERCGEPRRCEVSWAELFCVAKRRFDLTARYGTPWKVDQRRGKVYPDVYCDCDSRAPLLFAMTPMDADRLLQRAFSSQVVSPEQAAEIQRLSAALQPPRPPQMQQIPQRR